MRHGRQNDDRNDQGVALLLAMLFVVLLSAIVVEYAYDMQVEATLAGNHLQSLEAHVAAKSSIAQGLSLLAEDILEEDQGGEQFDCWDDLWAQGVPYTEINEAVMQCTIDDEYGKLNINALYNFETGEVHEELRLAFEALFDERGIDENPVEAIIDWIDPDGEPMSNGAEAEDYESLEIAYTCADGPMKAVEDLLLVRGITPEVFYGDPEEEQVPLTELLTVYGHPEGKVNVNTAEFEVLYAIEVALDSPGLAEQVIADREDLGGIVDASGYHSRGDEQNQQNQQNKQNQQGQQDPQDPEAQPPRIELDVLSDMFRLYGDGKAADTMVRIEAYVYRERDIGELEAFRIVDWRVIR